MVFDSEFIIQNKNFDIERIMEKPKSIKMSVGVDECLHIKFEYYNIWLILNDNPKEREKAVLNGQVTILQNSLRIKSMSIQLLQREIIKVTDIGKPDILSTTAIGSYEIMDGMAFKDEIIPIRMSLNRFNNALYTTFNCNQFKLQYFVNLGLVDEEDRRYFKTCEIFIYRS